MSELYTVEKKVADGVFPRAPGSTTLPTDKIKLVYNKFTPKQPIPKETTKINLVFAHGSGMNKGTWNYHIQKLYEASEKYTSWKINNVVAVDFFSHGDSAELNREKIGWTADWCDGGRDVVEVVKHEIRETGDFTPDGWTRNILVGHSLGGFAVLWAGYLEPQLFDSIILVEPVIQYTQALNEWFFKRMIKAGKFIVNEYPSVEAAHEHLKKKTFYNVMEKNVLDAFVDDELVVNKDGTVRIKAERRHQVATYCGVSYSAEKGMTILKDLQIPFYHITGADATWTPRESVDWIREEVPEHLLETADIPKGGHLVHGEQPLELVRLWIDFIDKRAKFTEEARKNFPEVKYGNDRKKIFEEQWKFLEAVDVENLYHYRYVRPKL
ncbi:hypothetical protein C7M61_003975 [Candidozyma pseudohaemuli]|uniref:AB hydrolase-1 domain-containing protein n=1 Tax=Candidozyma pseudohaemuli TaxID=418784 RepID=A0A2P7YKL4_9ASCO|nr:hypothetical protein C7M61_003975 [[Candida] pseudohaemulonii]PSK36502.1 hypothetical protein C7M61_003975 [[Candida] pseudohaemulonii]